MRPSGQTCYQKLVMSLRSVWNAVKAPFSPPAGRRCYPGTDLPVLSSKKLLAEGYKRTESFQFAGLVYFKEAREWRARFVHPDGHVYHLPYENVRLAGQIMERARVLPVATYAAMQAFRRKREEEAATNVAQFPLPRHNAD